MKKSDATESGGRPISRIHVAAAWRSCFATVGVQRVLARVGWRAIRVLNRAGPTGFCPGGRWRRRMGGRGVKGSPPTNLLLLGIEVTIFFERLI
jgi:hypothetical protein